jgi:hypothetical protein
MRRVFLFALSGFAVCALLSTAVLAGGRNLAEYPLRVHIYQFNGYSHYAYRTVDYVDGEGRANLFENGEPRGFDFKYRCSERLRGSAGFETYPARWRKQGKQLEILLPQFGKTDSFDSCDLDVLMKSDTVYHRHNGLMGEEPAATYKEWMEKHQYDPEHGKNEPVETAPTPAGANVPK